MSTMNSPTGYKDFEDLREHYEPKLTLVPYSSTPTVLNNCKSIYASLSKIMFNHLIRKDVINQEKCPKSYELLKVHQNGIKDGFQLLYTIVQQQSPHLGGYGQDPLELLNDYKIEHGDSLATLYSRTERVYSNIRLQQDDSGTLNRLVGKFCELLNKHGDQNIKIRLDSVLH